MNSRRWRIVTRSPRRRAALSMGVWQGRAPWRSCGSRPSRTWSEAALGDRPASLGGGATKGVHQIVSVGEQTAVSGKGRTPIDRRYVVPGRRRYDRRAMHEHERIGYDNKAASRFAAKSNDVAVSI